MIGITQVHGSAATGVVMVMAIIIAADHGRANGIPVVNVTITAPTIAATTPIDIRMIATVHVIGGRTFGDGQDTIAAAVIADDPRMVHGVGKTMRGTDSDAGAPPHFFLDIRHRLFYSSWGQ